VIAPTIAGAAAAGEHDADLIREAVIELKASNSSSTFCVFIVSDIYIEKGAIYSTYSAPSEWLMERVRRRYRNAGSYGGQECPVPEIMLGKIEPIPGRRNAAEVAVGLPHGTAGIEHVQVRRNWLGRWKARSVCCME
jgi:hypothetical protein